MSIPCSESDYCILLTGGAGFVGKVVLETLLRRQKEHPVTKITLLLRRGDYADVGARFETEIAAAPCFSLLEPGWEKRVRVVEGDLGQHKCGLGVATYESVCQETTHAIHCAGAVKLDLPLGEAVESNTVAALKVLELARDCPRLRRLVCLSSAYVTPWTAKPMREVLSPLPRRAEDMLRDVRGLRIPAERLLESAGLPNTFALSKSMMEHLVLERRENVSVTLIRPSFVSASHSDPFPGWIDSRSALSGLMITVGVGLLHVLDGNPEAVLDIIPVDMLAERIVEENFKSKRRDSAELGESHSSIVYAVTGKKHGYHVRGLLGKLVDYFSSHHVGPSPSVTFIGDRNYSYHYHDYLKHELPSRISRTWYQLCGEAEKTQQIDFMDRTVQSINEIFPYFTHHSFDFRPSVEIARELDPNEYLDTVFRGVQRHLMGSDPTQVPLARRTSQSATWLRKAESGLAWENTGHVLRTRLLKVSCNITFDQESFDLAIEEVPRGSRLVLIPSHTSYLDPMMVYHLIAEKPELGIKLPRIIASTQFADKPGIGWWLSTMGATFLPLGRSSLQEEEEEELKSAIAGDKPLLLFLEGKGFRSQRFVSPREGIFRSLQNASDNFVVLPVSVSSDLPPPDNAFSLGSGFGGPSRSPASHSQLGKVHIRCGEAMPFDASTDTDALRAWLSGQLQACATATTAQLQSFTERLPPIPGLDAAWLRAAIEHRGGTVVESCLSPATETALQALPTHRLMHNWQHLFFVESLLQRPDNPAIGHFVEENSFAETMAALPLALARDAGDQLRLERLLFHVFEPICRDYVSVARYVVGLRKRSAGVEVDLMATGCADYFVAQSALRCLVLEGFVRPEGDGRYMISASDEELEGFVRAAGMGGSGACDMEVDG